MRDSSRRALLTSLVGLGFGAGHEEQRSFQVLGLLRPQRLRLRPLGNARLHCQSEGRQFSLEGSQSLVLTTSSDPLQVTGPGGEGEAFVLEIPGVLQRSYCGVLTVSVTRERLQPVVTMDCETATSSIVGAELPQAIARFEALAAQAVVVRSVLLETNRRRHHAAADFCDTTHCQFLRSPAPVGSLVAQSVRATAGMVLVQDGRTIFARYSGACGGSTEGGNIDAVSYSSVRCEPCREANRVRRGHGWGLCQQGALTLASRGWSWPKILALYYPRAELQTRI